MVWNEKDKAAGLYILIELAAQMQAEEIFRVLLQAGKIIADRTGKPVSLEALAAQPDLERCLKCYLRQHGQM